MKLSDFEMIIDEEKFLQANERSAKGKPESWETQASIRRLEKYRNAKESLIPEDITNSINQFVNYDSNRI